MLVLLKVTYPPSSAKKMIDVFMSPQTPKRSEASKEIATFTYGDNEGYHGLVILDVEDGNFTDFLKAQTARNAYMQSRVEGLRTDVIPGLSVMDAIAVVSKQLS